MGFVLSVMASRLSLHEQLSTIMEEMAKSALKQVCTLVDKDSACLQQELSRLLQANSALTEKVNSLECELTIVKSDAPKLNRSCRTVGVQTVRCREEDSNAANEPVTIEAIFGKDWCVNLWRDKEPFSADTVTFCPPDDQFTETDPGRVTEIKEEYLEDDVITSQQDYEDSFSEKFEQLPIGYLLNELPFDEDGDQLGSPGGRGDSSMLMSDGAFSTHIIPIENEDDNEDIQLILASPQGSPENPAVETSDDPLEVLASDYSGKSTVLEDSSLSDFSVETPKRRNFTCKICSRTFFHKGRLSHHMKLHKSNFCSICKQHFPYKNMLKSHRCISPLQCHRGNKSCEICGKTFANTSALRIHYVVHTGEKPYTCSLCGKGFTQKGNLKCHLRIHTGERPFCCMKCGRTFTQKVNLNHHLMAHRNREVVGRQVQNCARNMLD